jgi:hypothetical protein
MKIIIYISLLFLFSFTLISAAEPNCTTTLSKLKPECNFIGKGVDKMKNFSKKNKTIDQSINNISDAVKKKINK